MYKLFGAKSKLIGYSTKKYLVKSLKDCNSINFGFKTTDYKTKLLKKIVEFEYGVKNVLRNNLIHIFINILKIIFFQILN